MSSYAEVLKTPHASLVQDPSARVELLNSSNLESIKNELGQSPGAYDDTVSAAYAAAGLVRRSLRFAADSNLRPLLNPENLATDGTTNCHGYSIVASECLDYVGVDHYICFANQHSFILLADPESNKLNMIDTPARQLYNDITGAIRPSQLEPLKSGASSSAAMIDGELILDRSAFTNKADARATRPWLSFQPNYSDNGRHLPESSLAKLNSLASRIYQPELGRQVLETYSNFNHQVNSDQPLEAFALLTELDANYPDIERRKRLAPVQKLVTTLANTSFLLEALAAIDVIKNSTVDQTADSYFLAWPADQKRYLAAKLGSKDLLRDAKTDYQEIISSLKNQDASAAQINYIRQRLDSLARQNFDSASQYVQLSQ